jgi:hypothetical protein
MNETTITYTCEICHHPNVWTRDQILQRGTLVVYRGAEAELDEYLLACRNPTSRPACPGRRKIAVPRRR